MIRPYTCRHSLFAPHVIIPALGARRFESIAMLRKACRHESLKRTCRLRLDLAAKHWGPAQQCPGRPERLPRPAPEIEIVVMRHDQPAAEPEPCADDVVDRSPGCRKCIP